MPTLSKGNRRRIASLKTKEVSIPIRVRNKSYRRVEYDKVIDKLMLLDNFKALCIEFKDFSDNVMSVQRGLRESAKKKHIKISTQPAEDSITIWKVVSC